MNRLALLILTTLVTMAGCSSEAAPDTAYHCIDDGVSMCSCQQGKVPGGQGNEVDACVKQPKDCCAFVEYQQGGAACECAHDIANSGLGFSSCTSYQASTYAKVSYQPRSTCP